ncbi:MAG: Unknown protein [uncultured Sulfurovum sp.]|uniref:DUF1778 domain-containing protein n=1 Tax=uncultured Sulfurovum sp. TaxID=269237 RepID=A0A6S6T0P1_9BACT|nr:MAG: Unknown protein [uncultured Sulfurovum sp.]
MNAQTPRITARVDLDTQELLSKAAALTGISSINSFVLGAAIEKAKKIIQRENALKLSNRDAMLFVEALDKPEANPRLKKALQNYENKTQ